MQAAVVYSNYSQSVSESSKSLQREIVIWLNTEITMITRRNNSIVSFSVGKLIRIHYQRPYSFTLLNKNLALWDLLTDHIKNGNLSSVMDTWLYQGSFSWDPLRHYFKMIFVSGRWYCFDSLKLFLTCALFQIWNYAFCASGHKLRAPSPCSEL